MMKKIFLLVAFFVLGKMWSYAQYPITQNIGADSTIVVSKGALQSRLINMLFTDTAQANTQRIRQYAGAQIATTTGGNLNLWVRNATATAWLPINTGSGNNIYTIDGTLLGNRTLTGAGYSLTFNQLSKLLFNADSTTINTDQATILNNGVSTLNVKGATGRIFLMDTTAPADERIYELKSSNGEFYISILNDAQTSNDSAFLITSASRVGINTLNPDSTLKVGGGVNILGGLRVGDLPTSPGTKQLRINAQGQFSVTDTLIDAGGTVTSVGTNNGSGITGGPITTTGTLAIDTTNVIATKASVSGGLAGKLNLSDTAAMLAPYLRAIDTASLSNRINTKLNISDTATMLGNYLNNVGYGLSKAGQVASADSATLSAYYLRRKDSLTVTNPLGYVTQKILADTAAAIRSSDLGGTVTSVATNDGTGITGGTITTSGTLAIDTTVISTRAWRQKGVDSLQANINLKLNISDTASMLNPYLRKVDTASLSNRINQKLNISDTASMLTNYVNNVGYGLSKAGQVVSADSATLSAYYLRRKDSLTTTNPLGYVTRKILADTAAAIRSADAGGTVTSVATNNGTGITGGTITTSGTLAIDTLLISTRAWRQKGIDSVAALANTKISGSLISGYLTKATGTLTVDTSQLYQSSGLIGIGTTSPTQKLQVSGNAYVNGQLFAGDTALSVYQVEGILNTPYVLGRKAVNNTLSTEARPTGVMGHVVGRGSIANRLQAANFYTTTDSASTANSTGSLRSVNAWTAHNGSGSLTTAWGSYNIVQNKTTGTITNAYGSVSGVENRGATSTINKLHGTTTEIWNNYGGTIDTAFGQVISIYNNNAASNIGAVYGLSIGKGLISASGGTHYWRNSGTIGTSYGLYLDSSIDVGTTKYALFSNSNSNSYFRAKLGVGTTSPDSAFQVATGAYFQRGIRASGLPSAPGTKALRIDASGTISVADTLIDAGGTVTSVATNNGTGITGGTITTTGTLAIDTLLISTRAWRQKGVDSLQANINQKLNISDTASMLSPYLRTNVAAATYVPQTRTITINGTSQDLSANRTYNVGTVTSVATNTGTGITGGTITSSGTIAADTLLLSTRAWRQKGIDSVAALINSNVSGTTNYVAKFTGTNTIGNSQLFDNGTNVGIGTTSPTERLQVNGAIRATGAVTNNTTGAILSYEGSSGSLLGAWGADASTYGFLRFYLANSTGTLGSEYMRLNTTGLGIGTTSPAYKLDVVNAGTNTIRVQNTSSTSDAYLLAQNTLGSTFFGINATGGYIYNGGALPILFYTSGNERMRLDASGNLGIGTSSPAAKLDVYQSAASTGLQVYTNDIGTARIVDFKGYDNSLGVVSRMIVQANGNVGIGTTSPGRQLEVYSATTDTRIAITNTTSTSGAAKGLELLLAGSDGYAYNYANGALILGTNASERMRITSGGNVLVGTTTDAGYKLDVNGIVRATGETIVSGGTLYLNNTDNSQAAYLVSTGTGGSAPLIIATNSTERMRITSGGSVGIGTSSPQAKLQVTNSTSDGIIVSTTANVEPFLAFWRNSASNGVGVLRLIDGGNLYFDNGATGAAQSTKMQLAATGAVRINSYGSGSFTGTRAYDLSVDASGNIIEVPVGAGTITGSGTTNYIPKFTSSSAIGNSVIYESGGSIGIGTTSLDLVGSTTSLTIDQSSGNGQLSLAANGTVRGRIFADNSTSELRIGNPTANPVMFFTNNTERMRLDASGNLGIGTSSPAYKLDVNGSGLTARIAGGTSSNPNLTIQSAIYPMIDFTSDDANSANRNWRIASVYNQYGMFEILSSTSAGGSPTTSRLVITNTGNVGIGTSSPNAYGGFTNLQVNNSTGNSLVQVTGSSSTIGSFYAGGGQGQIGTTSNHPFTLFTNDAERMRITSGGNVLVGTTTDAGYKLDVAGSLRSTLGGLFSGPVTINGSSIPSDRWFEITGTTTGKVFGAVYNPTFTYTGANIYGIYVGNNFGTGTITNSYNLFIEATNTGSATVSNKYGLYQSGSGDKNYFAGLVGIGTTSPDSLLTVQTGAWVKRGLRLSGLPTGTGTKSLRVDANGTVSVADTLANGISGTGTTNYIPKFTSSSAIGNSIMYEGSNVIGIGTISPGATLDVNGNSFIRTGQKIAGYFNTNAGDGYILNIGVASNIGYLQSLNGSTPNTLSLDGNDIRFRIGSFSEAMRLDASGNLGINTSSPAAKLDIGGATVGAVQAIFGRGNDDNNFTVRYTNGTSGTNNAVQGTIGLDYASGTWADMAAIKFIRNSTAGELSFFTSSSAASGTEKVRITSAGNVGIGTSNPNANLDVYTSQGGTAIAATHGVGGSYPKASGISFGATSTSLTVSNNGGTVTFTGGAGIYANNTASSNNPTDLVFWTTQFGSPAERMRIVTGGNVGIGTTSPTSKLQINSTSAGAATVGMFLNNESNTSSTEIRLAFAANTNNDIATNRYSYISAINTSGANGQALLFATNETGNSAVERMRITSGGEVGIGISSPTAILHTAGNTKLGGGTFQVSTDQTFISSYSYTFRDAVGINNPNSLSAASATTVMSIGSMTNGVSLITTGNIGIGTSSPGEKLQVNGNIYVQSGVVYGASSYSDAAVDKGMSFSGTNLLFNNSGERMRITSGGNVFVGSQNTLGLSLQRLTVTEDNSAAFLGIYRNNTAISQEQGGIQWMNGGAGTSIAKIAVNTSSDFTDTGNLLFFTKSSGSSQSEQMRITSGGNVGIGTSSPIYKFDVQGTSGTVAIRAASNTADDILFYATGTVTGTINAFNSNINATANVGANIINTNSSTGGSYVNVQVPNATSGNPRYILTTSGATNWSMGIKNSSDYLYFNNSDDPSNSSPVMTMTTGSNNVLIGTTTDAGYKLDVTGTLRVNGSNNTAIALTVNGADGSEGMVARFARGNSEKNFYISATNNQYVNLATEGDFKFKTGITVNQPYTSGVESMVITSAGRVGIGTTSPAALLHINSSASHTFAYSTISGASPIALDNQSGALAIWTASTERMRITSGGNVGIGTSIVNSKFIVVDNNSPNASGNITSGTQFAANIAAGYASLNVGAYDDGSSNRYGYLRTAFSDNAGIASEMRFYTGATEKMRITSGGNVGIGTTSPSGIFHAQATNSGIFFDLSTAYTPKIKASGAISDIQIESVGNGGNVYLNAPGSTSIVAINTNGSERMRITSGGNLLVGTTTDAGYKLDVNGNTRVSGNIIANGGSATEVTVYNSSSIRAKMSMTGNEGDLSLYGSSANKTVYLSAYYDSYFIANGGTAKLGIATTSPFSLLHVGTRPGAGTTNPSLGSIATVSNDGLTGIDLGANVNANNVVGHINWVNYLGVGNYNTARIDVYADGASNSGTLRFWTASASSSPTERMRITSGGNVLVGTTTDAGYKFDVAGSLRNTTSAYFATSSGSVGIGTTSPDASTKLQVESSNSSSLRVVSSALSGGDLYLTSVNSGSESRIDKQGTAGPLTFYNNGSERMRLTSGGELLINTTTDAGAYYLQVNGDVYASAYYESSDLRLKNVLSERKGSDGINTIAFKWKDGRDSLTHIGYAAQQVEKVLPDAVKTNPNGYKTINYDEVQSLKIANLEQEIAELKKIIKQLIDKK